MLEGGNIYQSGKCDKRQIVEGKEWRLMWISTFNQTLMYNVIWFANLPYNREHLFFFYLLDPDQWCIETLILIKIVSWWKFALGTNYNWQTAKKWNTTTLHNSAIVKNSKTFVISSTPKYFLFTKKIFILSISVSVKPVCVCEKIIRTSCSN